MNIAIKIHLIIIFRELKKIGILRLIFLTTIITFILIFLYIYSQKNEYATYISLANIGLVGVIHFNRKDKKFLNSVLENPKILYVFEYILVSLPVISILILSNKLFQLIYIFSGIIIISLINLTIVEIKTYNSNLRFIKNKNFEWFSGFRKNYFIIIPLYILGIIFSFFIGTVPIIMFFLSYIFYSFFQESENHLILEANEMSPKTFILNTLRRNLIQYFIFTIPFIVLFLIFHIEYWYIILYETIFLHTILIFSILQKYSVYEPNESLTQNGILLSFALISGLVPFLLPVVIFLTIRNYFKSINNLNFYLNAYN